MRVLQFGKFYPPDLGGIEKVMQDLCDGLRKVGVTCDVLCSNSSNNFQKDITPYGANIYRTASFGKLASTSISPQMIFKIRELIKNYDIIHVHLPDPMATLALFFANTKNKKIILHWHSDIINQRFLLNFFLPLQSWILKRTDVIIATSEKYIQESPYLQKYRHKCTCIPIGIDMPHQTKELSKNSNTILSVGRFVYWKGFEYLIESLQFLPKQTKVVLVGDGDKNYKKYLQKIVKELNLQDRVSFLGKKTKQELALLYQESNCFVLPSYQESYGIVLIEAMCYGLPLVCMKFSPSGSDWINQDGKTGFVVPPKNPQAIANAVVKIQENYQKLSQNSKERYQAHFTLKKMIQSIHSLYKTIGSG